MIATGTAVDFVDHGSGVQVFASAAPGEAYLDAMAPGDSFNNVPVARGAVDGSGGFTLRANIDSLPAEYRGPDGQVDLVIVVWDGENAGQSDVRTFSSPTPDKPRGVATVKADEKQVSQPGTEFPKDYLTCSTTLLSRGYLRSAEIGDSQTLTGSRPRG
ncbi:hypothetical protein [Nocardioides sp.]|uniref:hypothetical protein n=1 Tax=Nocardioides sp. TaxID=35761 RepID=UPI002ED7DD91